MRKVVLYIAISLDGYIAKSDGGIDWLSIVERHGEDYGYGSLLETIDTVIIGRKTFEQVLSFGKGFPYKDKTCYVITRQKRPHDHNNIFFNGNPSDLIRTLKTIPGKNILCDGGAEIINILIKNDQVDEFIISVIPVLLGKGIRLFDDYRKKMYLKLVRSLSYTSGLVQSHYRRI